MAAALTIERVHLLSGDSVIVELSDGRTLKLYLKQLLDCDPEVYSPDEQDSN